MSDGPKNGWFEKHVVFRMDEFAIQHAEHQRVLKKISEDITTLKFKASLWGAVSGLIPGLAALIYYIATKGK